MVCHLLPFAKVGEHCLQCFQYLENVSCMALHATIVPVFLIWYTNEALKIGLQTEGIIKCFK